MYQKRGNLDSCNSKTSNCISRKGQVTLFIIVGLVIFFIFLGLLQLSASLQKQQLTKTKERIYSDIFTKEALRIYVDRCLQEGMERGLVLLGQQGRIWSGQPGGREPFVEAVTGVTVGGNRLFYGIADDSLNSLKYPQYPNAYPCLDDQNRPAFCSYHYPNTTLGFGTIKLDRRFIQADLERFLTSQTVKCVEELVRSEINEVAAVETSADVKFRVAFNTGVITVKVNYPLRLKAGQGEFFHISQFDFTYPSDFDQLLTAAVLFPLRNDQKYVDFNYTEEVLLKPSFKYKNEKIIPGFCDQEGVCQQSTRSSQHAALGLRMKTFPLLNGDDLYQFTLPKDKIISGSGGEYTYQFVRQNRPPALDYVNRSACPVSGYDYLVLQGDASLGAISINLTALDPDEDRPTFSYEKPAEFPDTEWAMDSSGYFVGLQSVLRIVPKPEPYIFKARAGDTHKDDFQEVRVLVDQPLATNIKINSPFTTGEAHKINEKYFLSREDPYYLDLAYQTWVGNLRSREVTLEYVNAGKNNSFGHRFVAGQTNNCFSFPAERSAVSGSLTVGSCADLNFYTDPQYINQFNFPDQLQNPAREYFSEEGTYSLKATATYCGVDTAVSSNEVKVEVKGCIPYRNPEHPYSYPKHKEKFGLNPGTTNLNSPQGDEQINPFLATHACCFGDINFPDGNPADPVVDNPFIKDNFNKGEWRIALAGTPCYQDTTPSCYGRIEGYPNFVPGYILTTQTYTCNGVRGNVCFGDQRGGGRIISLSEGLKCGDPQLSSCGEVERACKGKEAWSYVTDENGEKGWCHGTMGCAEFSKGKEIVVEINQAIRFSSDSEYKLNEFVSEVKPTNDDTFFAHLGCDENDVEKQNKCDSNFDSKFQGTCTLNQQRRPICSGDPSG